ncbi:MAG: cytochrome c-type biogenesis protein CcmH [Asticcacaulis sp.]
MRETIFSPLPVYRERGLKAFLVVLFALTQIAAAVLPHEVMGNKAQDDRARALYAEVRCVVCQNESIADSSADIAADMRRDIRARIREGQSDAQIRDTLRARYGDYVLFRPRFALSTALLWGIPLLVLVGGAVLMVQAIRRRATPEDSADKNLSGEEDARLAEILNRDRDAHK